jgi:hypothetical protein
LDVDGAVLLYVKLTPYGRCAFVFGFCFPVNQEQTAPSNDSSLATADSEQTSLVEKCEELNDREAVTEELARGIPRDESTAERFQGPPHAATPQVGADKSPSPRKPQSGGTLSFGDAGGGRSDNGFQASCDLEAEASGQPTLHEPIASSRHQSDAKILPSATKPKVGWSRRT